MSAPSPRCRSCPHLRTARPKSSVAGSFQQNLTRAHHPQGAGLAHKALLPGPTGHLFCLDMHMQLHSCLEKITDRTKWAAAGSGALYIFEAASGRSMVVLASDPRCLRDELCCASPWCAAQGGKTCGPEQTRQLQAAWGPASHRSLRVNMLGLHCYSGIASLACAGADAWLCVCRCRQT